MGQTNPGDDRRREEPLLMRVYFGNGNDTFSNILFLYIFDSYIEE